MKVATSTQSGWLSECSQYCLSNSGGVCRKGVSKRGFFMKVATSTLSAWQIIIISLNLPAFYSYFQVAKMD